MTKIKKYESKQHEEGKGEMKNVARKKTQGIKEIPSCHFEAAVFVQLAIHHIFITMKAKDKKKMS